ncbi:MAG: M28 family peptidase [Deltaproteobacteria bacterium]|nr:M28 family peptidase [Deltaproteobacteria bacterium]
MGRGRLGTLSCQIATAALLWCALPGQPPSALAETEPQRVNLQEPAPYWPETRRLVSALLEETPLIEDLRSLTDEIGGRPTGSEANLRSVEWALDRFRTMGVEVRKEAFSMPAQWLENRAEARISGAATFRPRIAAMPFSIATPEAGLQAPLVDGGFGTDADFQSLGETAKGAFVIIETHELEDIDGLFREYEDAAAIERRAFAAGVTGVVYSGSRHRNVLYRHNAALGHNNQHPLVVMEREEALRTLRLLRTGQELELWIHLDLETGESYESYNVIGEIKGSQKPEEIIVLGAHLDSWGLGTGALDNGCNVVLLLDIARQIRQLGILPKRTIRFALWNGEEQIFYGSWGYTKTHQEELDRTIMASSFDIGSGRITGFYTNGRPELAAALDRALEPVAGLGPFEHPPDPVVGTDNFDFMMQGVANVVANQEAANYGSNYHASTDTFDKVDQRQLRLNSAIAGAFAWGFANMDVTWNRQNRAEIQHLIDTTDLGKQLRTFDRWQEWVEKKRGRLD